MHVSLDHKNMQPNFETKPGRSATPNKRELKKKTHDKSFVFMLVSMCPPLLGSLGSFKDTLAHKTIVHPLYQENKA